MARVMTPRIRKAALVAHVVCSVGWLGMVLAFIAMAVMGIVSADEMAVRGTYRVMEQVAWWALVSLAVASLVTGVLQSLWTTWGLFRHYWVVFKLGLTVVATGVLVLYMQTFEYLARVAADPGVGLEAVRNFSPALHSVAALVLLVATVLAVYKPRGLTRYGQRKKAPLAALCSVPQLSIPYLFRFGSHASCAGTPGTGLIPLNDASMSACLPWSRDADQLTVIDGRGLPSYSTPRRRPATFPLRRDGGTWARASMAVAITAAIAGPACEGLSQLKAYR